MKTKINFRITKFSTFLLEKITKFLLYLIIFLLPFFFLPFSRDFIFLPKHFFLFISLVLASLFFILEKISKREISLKITKINYFVLIIFISLLLSTIFSVWPSASFWGISLDIRDSLSTFVLFFLLFFLISNTFKTEKDIYNITFLLIISGFIVSFSSILSFYNIYPFNTLTAPTLVGRSNDILGFLLALFPLVFILSFLTKKFYKKILLWFILLFFFVEILFINFFYGWLLFLIEISLLMIFLDKYLLKEKSLKWRFVLISLLLIILFFVLTKMSLPGAPNVPPQVYPSFSSELNILKGTFKEGFKNRILGTGPGTFTFNWSKYHSSLINRTIFWATRFASGASGILDWIITKGILGGILLIVFFGYIIFSGFKKIIKINFEKDFQDLLFLGIFISLLVLIIFDIISVFNFIHWFLFWVILSFFVCLSEEKEKKIKINSRVIYSPIFSFILIAIVIFGFGGLFIEGKKYLGEIEYSKAVKVVFDGNIDEAINLIQKAINLNPEMDLYHRDIAQLYLTQATNLSLKTDIPDQERRIKIQDLVQKGIFHINEAIRISPKNVANWNVRGYFYRNFIGIPGAEEIAIESYKKAISLEPASPFAYGELGRVYLIVAQVSTNQRDKENALEESEKYLNKAIELKSDYSPAHYLLAIIYDFKGESEEAISRLEKLKLISPQDPGIYFQLGVIYWRGGELEKAQIELEKAIQISPNYSNARYILGLVYDKKGEKNKAIEQFQELTKLNPQNETVKRILNNLQKGLPALEGISSGFLPVQETPPEIQQ